MSDVLYHGSDWAHDELVGSGPQYSGSLGWGLYLTSSPEHARMHGRFLHEVRQPVPDERVADLVDLALHDCGDSLVLGTPGSSPFTFAIEDRKTGNLHRYSVLENCDGQVKANYRRWLLVLEGTGAEVTGNAEVVTEPSSGITRRDSSTRFACFQCRSKCGVSSQVSTPFAARQVAVPSQLVESDAHP